MEVAHCTYMHKVHLGGGGGREGAFVDPTVHDLLDPMLLYPMLLYIESNKHNCKLDAPNISLLLSLWYPFQVRQKLYIYFKNFKISEN
jgi:hypothetical protein